MVVGPGVRYKEPEAVTPIVQQAIATLDYDKFVGTLGLAKDKPLGKIFDHYTEFPPNPKKGNWVRVVSEFLVNDELLLLKGEAWICVSERAEGKAAAWEAVEEGEPEALYPTTRNFIGRMFRGVPSTTQKISPNTTTFVNFASPDASGAFNFPDMSKSSNVLTPLGNLPRNRVLFDFQVRLGFSPDFTGERQAGVAIYRYNPSANNIFATYLNNFGVDNKLQLPGFQIELVRPSIFLPVIKDVGELPITYAVAVWARHSANIDLSVTLAEITIIAVI